ncbi:MAG: hypothetical protein ACKOPG_05485 [Novosphingobium sp.]
MVRHLALGLALLFGLPAFARAQTSPDEIDRKVADRIEVTKRVYGAPDPRAKCRPSSGDEIVVCVDRGEDLEVPSTAETDPYSREARRALDGNIPSAPDVSYIKCRRGADGVCRGNIGSAVPPPYYIDMKAIPEPPEGSDADLIAKGEKAAP